MKNPETYISSLLELNDCVVIPDFGGFVLNETKSGFTDNIHKLDPPGKRPSFNRNLNVNDGLLANHIAKETGISYSESLVEIKNAVEDWKNRLSTGNILHFDQVGVLSMNGEQKILFEPDQNKNYLRSSFGFYPLVLKPIEKQNQPKIFALPSNTESERSNGGRMIRRTVAISAVAASLIFAFFIIFNQNLVKSPVLAFLDGNHVNSKAVMKSIQPIASSIGSIIDESTAKPVQKQVQDSIVTPNSKYYVVGGSFKVEANAAKFLSQLKEKGYKAQLLNNADGWFRVSYLDEQDSLKADKDLHSIKINENQSAWVLKF